MNGLGWWASALCLSLCLAACSGSDDDEQSNELDGDGGIQDFSDEVMRLRDDVDMLTPTFGELDGRLDLLEMPPQPRSCSLGELCVPDGVDLASIAFQPIISAVCAKITNCCEARELFYLYGNAIKNAAECEATLKDLIDNANIDSYYQLFQTQSLYSPIETVVRAAQALNDTKVFVEVSTAGVSTCAAAIAAEQCLRDQVYTYDPYCSASSYEYEYPCALSQLLQGKERAFDTCNPDSIIEECGADLVCRRVDGSGDGDRAQSGLCVSKAAAGDHCIEDEDCDDLYCDFTTGTCKARAKEGQHCELVDPTLEDIDPFYDEGSELRVPTRIDCEPGLACNPVSNTCVKEHCGNNSWCRGNFDCPANLVCTNDNPVFKAGTEQWGFMGQCVPGAADGSPCQFNDRSDNNCASRRCEDPDGDETYTCQPALSRCDPGCHDASCRTCAAGFYCESEQSDGVCRPKLEDGDPCSSNRQCASTFCNGLCAPRTSAGGSCSVSEECPADQYCPDGTCVPAAALGAPCNTPSSRSNCAEGLRCHDIDGPNSGSEYRCYTWHDESGAFVDLPSGTFCQGNSDWCESGWCRYDGQTYACSSGGKLAGELCDPSLDECIDGACELRNDTFVCSWYSGNEQFCMSLGGG